MVPELEELCLLEPDARYAESYLTLLLEHQAQGRFLDSRHIDNNSARLQRDFPAFVTALKNAADPAKTRPGYVPEFHFWLINKEAVVGRSTLRPILSDLPAIRDLGHIGYDVRPSAAGHGYGRHLLALTLDKAAKLGLERVLLTCDSHNEASKHIIEANNGVLECAVPIAGRNYTRLRYWINLMPRTF